MSWAQFIYFLLHYLSTTRRHTGFTNTGENLIRDHCIMTVLEYWTWLSFNLLAFSYYYCLYDRGKSNLSCYHLSFLILRLYDTNEKDFKMPHFPVICIKFNDALHSLKLSLIIPCMLIRCLVFLFSVKKHTHSFLRLLFSFY